MPNDQLQAIPRDPHDWRPQVARRSRRSPEIRDPILEPFWRGIRCTAIFRAEPAPGADSSLELLDLLGEDVGGIAPSVTAALSRSIMALDAVVDGILTPQATADATGLSVVPTTDLPATAFILPHRPEVDHLPPRGVVPGGELAFVALDLLSVDGQALFDLPLLERKRLLEGLFVEGVLVRVSPYTRPPVGPWLRSWKSAGFRGVMMKAANSRYRPGEETSEWALIEREGGG